MGRPTKYKSDFPDKVRKMVGLTHADMAKNLGVSVVTFQEHMKKYPLFLAAIKEADSQTDSIVESALMRRARGYEYEEEHREARKRADGTEAVTVKKIRKQMAPDVTAQIFWLKNRRPDIWRDKHEIEHSGDMDITVEIFNENQDT